MIRYRLSDAAQVDITDILAWTQSQFGEAARLRYESLIIAALRDVATQPAGRAASSAQNSVQMFDRGICD